MHPKQLYIQVIYFFKAFKLIAPLSLKEMELFKWFQDIKYGGTPLHWAKSGEILEALLEAGCSIDAKNFQVFLNYKDQLWLKECALFNVKVSIALLQVVFDKHLYDPTRLIV